MSTKSTSCYSKRTGEPLTEYYSEYEAQEGANYANDQYDNNLVPYQCTKRHLWHLSPKDRQTPSVRGCGCVDSAGNGKALYDSKEYAEGRANILHKEQGVNLAVYKCPYSDGWHLTKG